MANNMDNVYRVQTITFKNGFVIRDKSISFVNGFIIVEGETEEEEAKWYNTDIIASLTGVKVAK